MPGDPNTAGPPRPVTAWAVALLYFRIADRSHVVCSVAVGDVRPLSEQEAIARAKRVIEDDWDARKYGPYGDLELVATACDVATVG
jgi:predicted nucleotidyltransferase